MSVDSTRVDVFEGLFLIFLGLGTLVGIIVIAYMLYNAYKYRDVGERDEDVPTLGELPTGSGGGKKLFVSFFLSALIVISLIVWSYGLLLQVEDPSGLSEEDDALDVEVVGENFAWEFTYDNGVNSFGTLRVPAEEAVRIQVTSGDVWHTFGIPDQRVKADAIPGEYDETWFQADGGEVDQQQGIECFELCGPGHTTMEGTLQIMDPDDFDAWMDGQLDISVTVLDGDVGEDEDPGPYTGDFEAEVVNNETDETFTFTQDDVDENGTYTIDDIDQAGDFILTITPADDTYETYEASISNGDTHDAELQLAGNDSEDSGGEN